MESPGMQLNMIGADLDTHFDQLNWRQVETVVILAKEAKYRRPKNAQGSRARYYYYKLQRELRREKAGKA